MLYGIGGPKTSGSLRDIRIIRDGIQIGTFDLYELLVKGTESEQIVLLNNDEYSYHLGIQKLLFKVQLQKSAFMNFYLMKI